MKKFLCYFLFDYLILSPVSVFARSYLRTKLPLAGKTLVPYNMQAIVLGQVYARVDRDVDGCRKFKVLNTKVTKPKINVEYNRRGEEIGGTWSEEWTVDACGTSVIVPLNLTTKKKGVKSEILPVKNSLN